MLDLLSSVSALALVKALVFAPIMMPDVAPPTSYQIARSLRFRPSSTTYLTRTMGATPTDGKKITVSYWIKLSNHSTQMSVFSDSAATNINAFEMQTTGAFNWQVALNAASVSGGNTVPLLRDIGAWTHILLVYDSTSATTTVTGGATDRIRVYYNGVQAAFSGATAPALNFVSGWGTGSQTLAIGRMNGGATRYFDGYLADIYWIDGQALTPGDFAQTDATTGVWTPKTYAGTYGNNGFHLDFADNSAATATTLGKDTSGNGNNWTPNGSSVTAGVTNDSLTDSPTNYGTDTGVGGEVRGNYCTWNRLANPNWATAPTAIAGGNLDLTNSVSQAAIGTFGMVSGKWYFEYAQTANAGNNACVGIANAPLGTISTSGPGQSANGWAYYTTGNKGNSNSIVAYGASWTVGDIVGVAFDADAGTLVFYKNGASQGTAYSGLTAGPYFPCAGSGAGTVGSSLNAGQRPFANTAPSGFKALCTQNIADPAIIIPSQYFDAPLWTGTAAALNITGIGFAPDMLWGKSRNAVLNHSLMDTVRGASQRLQVSLTNAEDASGLASFNADGVSITAGDANLNASGNTHVGWMWKKGTTPGLDIVTYTGTGANRTIAHGLGVVPAMMIIKTRSTTGNWPIYHKGQNATPAAGSVYLNTLAAYAADATLWNSAVPTTTVFSAGTSTQVNQNTATYAAWLFAEVPGFSRFDRYTGTGAADGPFVWCGFRPKFILIKRIDTTGDWRTMDAARSPINPAALALQSDSSAAEITESGIDFLSNGFKIRMTVVGYNATGGTYIFAAFAENPFKYTRAR